MAGGTRGEMETSVMMALHPEWVKADRLQKDGHPPQSERAGQVARYRWIHQSTDRGTYGDPTFGSRRKGRALHQRRGRDTGPHRRGYKEGALVARTRVWMMDITCPASAKLRQ